MLAEKIAKVNDAFTVYRYDNGWMIEVSGRDSENDYRTSKTLCTTEDDLIALIKQYNSMEVDN